MKYKKNFSGLPGPAGGAAHSAGSTLARSPKVGMLKMIMFCVCVLCFLFCVYCFLFLCFFLFCVHDCHDHYHYRPIPQDGDAHRRFDRDHNNHNAHHR